MSMDNLTTEADVKRICRFTNEITSSDVSSFIRDSSREIYEEYGWPIATMNCAVDKDEKTYYLYPSNKQGRSVGTIDIVQVDGSTVDSGSYTSSTDAATITLGSDIEIDYDGDTMRVGFSPLIYQQLATFMTSFDLIQSYNIISQEGEGFPRTAWLTQRIASTKDAIRTERALGSSKYTNYNPYTGDSVDQDDVNTI